jgi:hypothetical protein
MFNYENAFSRNIGWVTHDELQKIKNTKIAIAGLGGAGGEHAMTLARMGFQNFHLSDFDEFEEHNFNRQAGAFISTIDKPKCETIAAMLKDINPNATIKTFPNGINEDNIEDFFDGVDIYVDGIDFFAMKARLLVYEACKQKGIPNLLAAPLGMGCAVICYTKDSMPYDQYYRFHEANNDEERFIKLLIGLSPALIHKSYLADESAANFKEKRGPSTPMAIKLCSGILVSNVVKIALNRGKVITAPRVQQFDAYKNKFVISNCPFGTNGPIQRIKFKIAKKMLL